MSKATVETVRRDVYDIFGTLKLAWCSYHTALTMRVHGPIPANFDLGGFVRQIGEAQLQASVSALARVVSKERNDRRSLPKVAAALCRAPQAVVWPPGTTTDRTELERVLGSSVGDPESALVNLQRLADGTAACPEYRRLHGYRNQFVAHMDERVDDAPFWSDLPRVLDAASDVATVMAILVLPSTPLVNDLRFSGRPGERSGADQVRELVERMLAGVEATS